MHISLELAHQGMLHLLKLFPHVQIVKYDAQICEEFTTQISWTDGPWVCIDLTNGEKFAILKATGNVYRVDETGAAEDDPLITVTSLD
jgi:hypothetical protein